MKIVHALVLLGVLSACSAPSDLSFGTSGGEGGTGGETSDGGFGGGGGSTSSTATSSTASTTSSTTTSSSSSSGGGTGGEGGGGLLCEAGFADCDLAEYDGCETDIMSNVKNCGGCGLWCPTSGVDPSVEAGTTCEQGVCLFTCTEKRADCNGIPWDGCEVSLNSDAQNCGECGHVCDFGKICGYVPNMPWGYSPYQCH